MLLALLSFFSVSVFNLAEPQLPPPNTDHKVKNYSEVVGWAEGETPKAPDGFQVTKFADDFRNPRWMYVAENGDLFVSEAEKMMGFFKRISAWWSGAHKSQNQGKSANRITRFTFDEKGEITSRKIFLEDLNQPFGMLIYKDHFYVANTDGIFRYSYQLGSDHVTGKAEKILDLPKGGYNNHWTRNIILSADRSKIYVAVGSASNVGEYGMKEEVRRANILVIDLDGENEKIFASGLRNPVGMDIQPESQKLWTAVNERDNLGDDLVPDYITEVTEGGFYGWPYAYFGSNVDPRIKNQRADLVEQTLTPDLALGSHTASLGLHFYDKKLFPKKYHNGAFIAQRGSWNRSQLVGYRVVFVPFKKGKPSGEPQDFLTGFIKDEASQKVHGRPVGITSLKDGSLLVTDDASNTIWRVKPLVKTQKKRIN
jgi:glucose/arabinose dehydrogenase